MKEVLGKGILRHYWTRLSVLCARLVAVAALVAPAMGLCSCRGSCRDRAKPAQRRVVLYCSADQQYAEEVIAAFEKRTGVKVLARYDTEAGKTVGLVQRIRSEAAAPGADVFWSSEVFHTIRLAREGLLAPYSPADASRRAKVYNDAGGLWHGFAARARVICYNTLRVSPDEAPRRLEDLLDAKWAGRCVMADPAFGTTGGDVASWFAHYGDQRAMEILRGLKANDMILADGNSTAVRMVATGQADICLTDTDDVYAAVRNGWPVAMNYLDQGGDGVLTIPNTVAVIAGGPHPAEARLLAKFLLSGEVEIMLAESDSHNIPTLPGLAGRFARYAVARPLSISYQNIADKLPTATGSSRKILR